MLCSGFAVFGCSGGNQASDVPYVEESPANEPPCSDPLADPLVLEKERIADRLLKAALSAGNADPIEEARKAASAGDFRLVAAVTLDGIDTRQFGALCVLPGGLSPRAARVVTYLGDGAVVVPNPVETEAAGTSETDSKGVTTFARAYNQALIADLDYPYRDICRPLSAEEADAAAKDMAMVDEPVARAVAAKPKRVYGYGDLGPLTPNAALADAARRGNVAALRGMLAEDGRHDDKTSPQSKIANDGRSPVIDNPDLFGMTPLAWAIAYRKDAAARLLLSRRANPSGAPCQALVDRDSPMQIARRMGWVSMVMRMKSLISSDDYAALADEPALEEGNKSTFNGELARLGGKYGDIFNRDEMTRHALRFKIAANGDISSCSFEPKSASADFDSDICQLGREILEWRPARDSVGRAVAGEAQLIIRLRGANPTNVAPQGNAAGEKKE